MTDLTEMWRELERHQPYADFEFLQRVGRILADRGPDCRLENADVVQVDGRIVVWPDSAEDAADEEIRIFRADAARD